MVFQPGQSGNPGGRPANDNPLKVMAREKTPEAFKRLIKLLDSDEESIRLGAIKVILDRAYGQPRQEIELSGDANNPVRWVLSDSPTDPDIWEQGNDIKVVNAGENPMGPTEGSSS